jgi:hypothetical protein
VCMLSYAVNDFHKVSIRLRCAQNKYERILPNTRDVNNTLKTMGIHGRSILLF